jgi:hypothetical protein
VLVAADCRRRRQQTADRPQTADSKLPAARR